MRFVVENGRVLIAKEPQQPSRGSEAVRHLRRALPPARMGTDERLATTRGLSSPDGCRGFAWDSRWGHSRSPLAGDTRCQVRRRRSLPLGAAPAVCRTDDHQERSYPLDRDHDPGGEGRGPGNRSKGAPHGAPFILGGAGSGITTSHW
jgi:hypothetical protein